MEFLAFLAHLKDRPKARELYTYFGKKYASWLKTDIRSLNRYHFSENYVRSFLSTLENAYTANAFLSMCRSFTRFIRFSVRHNTIEDLLEADRLYSSIKTIRFREIPFYIKASAITLDKLKELIENADYELASAIIVHFYFGARPIELAKPYRVGSITFDRPQECVVDFKKNLIAIPNAKRKGVSRILPFDGIEEYVKEWVWILSEEVQRYYRPRQWFSDKIRYLSDKLGFRVTAKTARKTFETEMTKRGVAEWELRYWLGHKTQISDVYRDFTLLMDKLREDIVSKHYIVEIL
jgi:hypothetical protein